MTANVLAVELTSLQRLSLRETLQDHWREQVRRITLLSMAMYDDLDAAEPTLVMGAGVDTVEAALVDARRQLAGLEAAMHRLDDGSYGRCAQCERTVDYMDLVAMPLATTCRMCRMWSPGRASSPGSGG